MFLSSMDTFGKEVMHSEYNTIWWITELATD